MQLIKTQKRNTSIVKTTIAEFPSASSLLRRGSLGEGAGKKGGERGRAGDDGKKEGAGAEASFSPSPFPQSPARRAPLPNLRAINHQKKPLRRREFRLCFKASPSAKPFIWKFVLFTCLHVNTTNFHMKGFALGLALKQRQNETRKSPIFTRSFYFILLFKS